MDTGYPHPLMLLLHLHLRRKRPCPALTLEIASRLGTEVGKAVALTNAAGAVDPPQESLEIVHSKGVPAVARGLPLDLDAPRGTDILETLHPGGETHTPTPPPMNYYVRVLYFRQKDI